MHSDYSLMHVSQPFWLRTFWDIFLALFTLLYLQSFIECCICISSRCFAEHYNLIIFIGFNKNLLTVTKQTTMNSRENNWKFSFTLCYGPKYLVFTESIAGTKFIIFTYLALYSWSAKRDAASVNIEKNWPFYFSRHRAFRLSKTLLYQSVSWKKSNFLKGLPITVFFKSMPSFSREQLESREAPGKEPGQGLSSTLGHNTFFRSTCKWFRTYIWQFWMRVFHLLQIT